jgi:hypothetical protein
VGEAVLNAAELIREAIITTMTAIVKMTRPVVTNPLFFIPECPL